MVNGAVTGEVPTADRDYMARLVSSQTGVSPEEARQRVDALINDAKTAAVKARQALDAARKATATLAIVTALAMLIGAFVACVAAAYGGQERDEHR